MITGFDLARENHNYTYTLHVALYRAVWNEPAKCFYLERHTVGKFDRGFERLMMPFDTEADAAPIAAALNLDLKETASRMVAAYTSKFTGL